MKSKIAAALIAATTIGATFALGTTQASAHWHGHGGWGWGGFGAGLAIGAIAATTYDRCYLAPRYDRFGNYIGRVRVCNY